MTTGVQADGEARAAASAEVPGDAVIEAAGEVAEDSQAGVLQALTAGTGHRTPE